MYKKKPENRKKIFLKPITANAIKPINDDCCTVTDADWMLVSILCIEIPKVQHPEEEPLVDQIIEQFIFSHCNNKSTSILWCFASDYSRLKEALIICNGHSTGGMLSKMKITVSVDRGAGVKWSHYPRLEKTHTGTIKIWHHAWQA